VQCPAAAVVLKDAIGRNETLPKRLALMLLLAPTVGSPQQP